MSTLKMLERLFDNDSAELAEIAGLVDEYGQKFGLNTDLRLGHFLAQVREEVGSEFKVLRENLNYRSDALRKIFGNRFTEAQAREYGRGVNSANQEMIANIAYANRLGNGDADSGDGWKYRGAGCLQITGKGNFEEVQKRCVRYAGKEMDPDTLEGFVVFGFAYWMQHDLYRLADKGKSGSVVDSITAKINYHTHSYANRVAHFGKIKELIK